MKLEFHANELIVSLLLQNDLLDSPSKSFYQTAIIVKREG